MPTFHAGFKPASAKAISRVEKSLDVKLPTDYKTFLQTQNGGVPSPSCFTVPHRGDALCDYLYGIRSKRERCDLEYEQELASQWDPLPPGFIAIGHDPGGNTLLLATKGKESGSVFFWDRNGLWIRKDGHNTFPVAMSFTDFLQSLHEMPGDASSSTSVPSPKRPRKKPRPKKGKK